MVKSTLLSRKWIAAVVLATGAITFGAPGVRADMFQLTSANKAGLGTSPYVDVTITQGGTSNSVNFTISVDHTGGANTGDLIDSFGFNIGSNSVGTLSLSGQPAHYVLSNPGGNFDGFGDFDLAVGSNTAANGDRLDSFSFTLTSTVAITPSDFENFNTIPPGSPPLAPAEFAAHFFNPNAGLTGFVGLSHGGGGGGGGNLVPEPSSLALAGISCAALLGWWGVRRRKSVAA